MRRDKNTRRNARNKLPPLVRREFYAAGQNGDLKTFERLLNHHAPDLPREAKDELIKEFRRSAASGESGKK